TPDGKELETKTMHGSGKLCVSLMFAAICVCALGQRHAEAVDKVINGIIASDSIIKSNPDLVRRFVTATMQGLKDAIANPQEAGAIMNKHHREVDADVATGETKIVGTLTGQPLGVLDAGRVKKAIEIVSGAYTLKFAVTPEDIYAPGFVN